MEWSNAMITDDKTPIISHQAEGTGLDLEAIRARLIANQDQLKLPLGETLNLLDQLAAFELGRFLLRHRGLNGYWTAYLILQGPHRQDLSPLEQWILHRAPVFRATRERFFIFQRLIQERLRPDMSLASIPCGLMDDLLSLDYSMTPNVRLTGIDLDAETLSQAQTQAAAKANPPAVSFLQRNAWQLEVMAAFDLIASNGLNFYEPNDMAVIKLYRQFQRALKPKGVLITSFLTPPPALTKDSPWKDTPVEDLRQQAAIFGDIIGAKWQVFRTEPQMREHFDQAGLDVQDIIYDSQAMFPTIIAEKRG